MIDRYTTESMGKIWSDHNKYKVWLKVELAVLEVLCEDGIVPNQDLKIIWRKLRDIINYLRLSELSKKMSNFYFFEFFCCTHP